MLAPGATKTRGQPPRHVVFAQSQCLSPPIWTLRELGYPLDDWQWRWDPWKRLTETLPLLLRVSDAGCAQYARTRNERGNLLLILSFIYTIRFSPFSRVLPRPPSILLRGSKPLSLLPESFLEAAPSSPSCLISHQNLILFGFSRRIPAAPCCCTWFVRQCCALSCRNDRRRRPRLRWALMQGRSAAAWRGALCWRRGRRWRPRGRGWRPRRRRDRDRWWRWSGSFWSRAWRAPSATSSSATPPPYPSASIRVSQPPPLSPSPPLTWVSYPSDPLRLRSVAFFGDTTWLPRGVGFLRSCFYVIVLGPWCSSC